MSFRVAISGLNAASADLAVTANNIANTGTTGFKGSRVQFAELFSVSSTGVSKTTPGNGVRVADVAQQFNQGNIDFTDNSLDLAISGQGFFILNDGGARAYSRAGAFQVDRDGFVVNSTGQRLQSFPPTAQGGFNTGALHDLRLVTGESPPTATTSVSLVFNLPAAAAPPTVPTFSPSDPDSYNHSSSMTVYDSLGAAHTATVYLNKTAAANEWQQRLFVDGNAVGAPQTLTYSGAGLLTAPAGGQIAFPPYTPATGAEPMTLSYDFGDTTQYGQNFTRQLDHAGRLHDGPPDRHRHRFLRASCRRASPMAVRWRSARSRWRSSRTRTACSSSATPTGPRPSAPGRRCAARPATPASG